MERALEQPLVSLKVYNSWWRAIATSKSECTLFWCYLARKTDEQRVAMAVSHEAAIATLLLIALHYNLDPQHPDFIALAKKVNDYKKQGKSGCVTLDYLVNVVQQGPGREVVKFVNLCTAVHVQPDAFAVTHGIILDFLVYTCVRGNNHVGLIWNTIICSLRADSLTQGTTLALLQLSRQVVQNFPRFTDEELDAAIAQVGKLRLWPTPVCCEAISFLAHMNVEKKLRGACMWLKLWDILTHKGNENFPDDGSTFFEALEQSLTVHLELTDETDWSRAFKLLFVPSTVSSGDICVQLRSMLLALFRNLQPLSVGSRQLAVQPDEMVCLLAVEAMLIVRAVQRGEEIEDRLHHLAQLVTSKARASSQVPSSSSLAQPALPGFSMRILEPASFVSEGVVYELREACELSGRFLYNDSLLALHSQLVVNSAMVERCGFAPPLRVCAAGDDNTLHRLLQAFVVLRCAYPQLCARADLRFYLVPLGRKNTLARYISTHDGWYRRSICAPHSDEQPLVPHLIVSTDGDTSQTPLSDGPHAPLQRSLSDYFTHAQHKLEVKVFEARCWLAPQPPATDPDAPFMTIAFSTSVQLLFNGSAGGLQELSGVSTLPLGVSLSLADAWGVQRHEHPKILAGRFAALSFACFSESEPRLSPTCGRLMMQAQLIRPSNSRPIDCAPRYLRSATITTGSTSSGNGKGGGSSSRYRAQAGESDRFSLLIDGAYYGPFAQVDLIPCCIGTSSQEVTLPLHTYFPIE